MVKWVLATVLTAHCTRSGFDSRPVDLFAVSCGSTEFCSTPLGPVQEGARKVAREVRACRARLQQLSAVSSVNLLEIYCNLIVEYVLSYRFPL